MKRIKQLRFFMVAVMLAFAGLNLQAQSIPAEMADSLVSDFGINLLESEIDAVLFQTNEFLTDATFIGASGPFWWILESCMALGALFAIIMAAGMAYKMMVKGEPFDVLKILRVLGIAIVMFWWYPHSGSGPSVLGVLAYIPNCIGSYTHDLYEIEAAQVQERLNKMRPLIQQRDTMLTNRMADFKTANEGISKTAADVSGVVGDYKAVTETEKNGSLAWISSSYAGFMIALDKIIIFASLVIFRIGWWATIYIQQIMLGMLTIFGPIMWAFSILPKWEGSWAKWITRYLTVHFYGAMLYFVGFYVLLLFDVVISIQTENLQSIISSPGNFQGYLQNTFLTAGYLMAASIVALKCLNLVPDLAAWMIPEGDTTFAARSFGEGVASGVKTSAMSVMR